MRILILTFYLFAIVKAQSPNPKMWVTNGEVKAIALDSNYTYLGGSFTLVGPYTGYSCKLTSESAFPNMNFPKINGNVCTAVPDGSGGWYIGGNFTKVGTEIRNNIARIDSDGTVNAWNPNADGVVYTIVVNGPDIYVGGHFFSIGGQVRSNLAKLNNTTGIADMTWDPNAHSDTYSYVYTIAINGSDIYVGGDFTLIGNQTRNNLAKLNNTTGAADETWNPNANNGGVRTIAVSGSGIFVGGYFDLIGGQRRSGLAKLNNTTGQADLTWNPNASHAYTSVYTISVSDTDIYVGEVFSFVLGGYYLYHIAKLNNTTGQANTTWKFDCNNVVRTIAVSDSNIYAGGEFTTVMNQGYGSSGKYLVKLNNFTGEVDKSWNPNADDAVITIAVNGSDIYAGGWFSSLGGLTRNNLVRLNNTTGEADTAWNPIPDKCVNTLAITGSDIYAGGEFTWISGLYRNKIAKLNNTTGDADMSWNSNPDGSIYTIAVTDSDIYIGGNFTTIGSLPRNNIAKLNNTTGQADATWKPNANGKVNTIAINGSDIYVGGNFNLIGGQTRNYLAKLNNTTGDADMTWNSNSDGSIYSIAINGSDIYTGGTFTSIGSQSRNHIAKLNNSTGQANVTWNPNANGTVHTIAVNGSDIYVGGNFYLIGGQRRNSIARLNNTSGEADINWNLYTEHGWGAGDVEKIVIKGLNIYVGGYFDLIGGEHRNGFAMFTDSVVSVEDAPLNVYKSSYDLSQNYPNPFNPSTVINFSLESQANVSLKIYDILGREIATLVNGRREAGRYSIPFNAKELSSGVYIYVLKADNKVLSRKMELIK